MNGMETATSSTQQPYTNTKNAKRHKVWLIALEYIKMFHMTMLISAIIKKHVLFRCSFFKKLSEKKSLNIIFFLVVCRTIRRLNYTHFGLNWWENVRPQDVFELQACGLHECRAIKVQGTSNSNLIKRFEKKFEATNEKLVSHAKPIRIPDDYYFLCNDLFCDINILCN